MLRNNRLPSLSPSLLFVKFVPFVQPAPTGFVELWTYPPAARTHNRGSTR